MSFWETLTAFDTLERSHLLRFSLQGASKPSIVTTSVQATQASFSFQSLRHHGDIVAYQTRCQGAGNELVIEIITINLLSKKVVVRNLAPNRRYKCQV